MSRQCFYVLTMLTAGVLPIGCSQPTSNQPETMAVAPLVAEKAPPATAPAVAEKTPAKPAEVQKAIDNAPKNVPATAPVKVADAKPIAKPTPKPADKPADKPAAKPAMKPADKPAMKPMAAPATKPATAPATKPARKPAEPRKASDAVSEVNRNPRRHDGFLATIKKGEAHQLVFIGDSITDGWPGKGKESWAKFAEYKPLDLGVSGERTEDVLFRLNHGELEGYKPKVAVIMIGTNNIGHNKDEKSEWVAAGIEKIVKTIREKQPDTKILLLGVFPRDTAASASRAKIKEINSQIAKLDDGKKVKFLDIGGKFLDDKGEIPGDVMGDKLHPSAKGYDIWYEAMWPTLSAMLK